MSRTRLFVYSLPLVALLAACSGGGGSQSTLPADPASVSQPTTQSQPVDPSLQSESAASGVANQEPAQIQSGAPETEASQSLSAQGAAISNVPSHIATWAKDLYNSAGALGTSAQAKAYLTYAQGGDGNAKALNDCRGGGCQSVFYFDPHMLYDSSVCAGGSSVVRAIKAHANETWYVHETGHTTAPYRIHGSYVMECAGKHETIPVYAMNTLSSTLLAYYRSYFLTTAAGWNHFFMDDTSAKVLTQFYGAGGGFCLNEAGHLCTSTEEMRTDAAVVSEHTALANAIPVSGFYNGINFTGSEANDLNILDSTTHFEGAICEDCVVNSGVFRPTMYAPVLNTMAAVNRTHGAFVELNHGESAIGSAAQIAQRAITTAMAWLGYSEGHTIVYPDLEANTDRLAIYPENSIYPTTPIETMSTGAANIEVASGVYRREFRTCYNNRVAIGACAAIVNGTSRNVVVSSAWLHQAYGHVVELIGGDIPGGGRVSLTSVGFAANRTYIAPYQGLMIVR